ncbi:helix-turn-helix domain-containing protein [Streptomyces sp. SDr-06]|uniref:helix-turn-helix domain-containing protein n=1 Tax=Streptomyces sp. SDr-06 TaxID=2267702 RepID=UPI001CB9A7A1|nr:helix-turn-helix domain-containing protein [Streptomyces sp. SDr-06]
MTDEMGGLGAVATWPGSAEGRGRRAEDVLAMQRAARKGGSQAVLAWLAVRSRADVLLASAAGAVLSTGQRRLEAVDSVVWDAVVHGLRELTQRRAGSMAIDSDGTTIFLYPLVPGEPSAPVLTAMTPHGADGLAHLLADAASTLSLCWKAEHAESLRSRLETAASRTREVVLHLLMNGHVPAAHQVAGALNSRLAASIQVGVVETAPARRSEVAAHLTSVAPDTWIVFCPVYDGHLIVLTPAAGYRDALASSFTECVAATLDACWVGMSDPVPLLDTATGYAQAFHALAAARHRTDRRATFASSPDLALAIGPDAYSWTEHFLAPLRRHSPRRSQDPGSAELLATASSWLSFSSKATNHLKIHRNTLSSRLKHIATQLGLDLGRLGDQSALALALRVLTSGNTTDTPPRPVAHKDSAVPDLDALLAQPAVTQWARIQFQPLATDSQQSELAKTLAAWLQHDADVEATAAGLSLSVTAVRKRLTRAEAVLQRSLLRPPSARHDLWLAQRALNLVDGGVEMIVGCRLSSGKCP